MLDTMRQMESHLLMRHYDGFLKRAVCGGAFSSDAAVVEAKIVLKTEQDLALMRPACVIAQTVLDEVCEFIQPASRAGRSTSMPLDDAPLRSEERVSWGIKVSPLPVHLG